MVELQGRVLAASRWNVLLFGGRGFTSGDLASVSSRPSIYSYGTGARFNVFEERNIWVGIDIARGPEDWAWYIQVNHPW